MMSAENRSKKRSSRRPVKSASRPLRHALMAAAFHAGRAVCALPSHRMLLHAGSALGGLAAALAPAERRKVIRNLALAYGDELTDERKEEIARGVFRSLGMMTLESLQFTRWKDEYYHSHIVVVGREHWDEAHAHGRGSVFLTGHTAGWELMPQAFRCISDVPLGVMMRDIRNPILNDAIIRLRSGRGVRMFSNDASPITYFKLLRRGGVLAILSDQDTRRVRGIDVPFFGRPARTPVGGAVLARATGAAVLPVFLHRHADDPTVHTATFSEAIFPDPDADEETDILRILTHYNAALERHVRKYPEQWVWIHERWKRGGKET